MCSLVSLANKLAPSIIFIDEIDCCLRSRTGFEHDHVLRVKTEFMTLWDGLLTGKLPATATAARGCVGIVIAGTRRATPRLPPAPRVKLRLDGPLYVSCFVFLSAGWVMDRSQSRERSWHLSPSVALYGVRPPETHFVEFYDARSLRGAITCRATHWQPQSVDTMLASPAVSILDCVSIPVAILFGRGVVGGINTEKSREKLARNMHRGQGMPLGAVMKRSVFFVSALSSLLPELICLVFRYVCFLDVLKVKFSGSRPLVTY